MSFETVMPPFNASDPSASFLSTSCLDFLLIELVPMAYRVTNELEAASQERAQALATGAATATAGSQQLQHQHQHQLRHQLSGPEATGTAAAGAPAAAGASATDAAARQRVVGGGGTGSIATSGVGTAGASGTRKLLDEDEERDAVFFRLEMLGYRVGRGLAERFSRDRPRFNDTLDVIKFLCKDLWTLVFRKQIDNLKTNHRGVFVLTDNSFRPFQRMSTEAGGQAIVRAQPFLWFPCGIVRGALAALGITATVQAESSELPGAIFQIKTVPAKT